MQVTIGLPEESKERVTAFGTAGALKIKSDKVLNR